MPTIDAEHARVATADVPKIEITAPPVVVYEPAPQTHRTVCTDGRDLWVPTGAVCPPRCVKCNAPADRAWTKELHWAPPIYLWFLLLGALPAAVVIYIVTRSARVTVYLCPEHERQRARAARKAWGVTSLLAVGLCASVWAGIVAAKRPTETIAVVTGILFCFGMLVALFWATRAGNPVAPRAIDHYEARLKGAGAPFLASLPAFEPPGVAAPQAPPPDRR
ncbi:MAG TPA: hypothetical protein VEA69_03660 [Tepidisphaeraceae bacterium]|nr:hypothetical protein [Tepidisphaeraceae bacterium]